MFTEVVVVGRALGYGEDILSLAAVDAAIERTALYNKQADSRHRPSMLLDLQRGNPIELDVILGELVQHAREVNVDIPVSSCIPHEDRCSSHHLADRDNACASDRPTGRFVSKQKPPISGDATLRRRTFASAVTGHLIEHLTVWMPGALALSVTTFSVRLHNRTDYRQTVLSFGDQWLRVSYQTLGRPARGIHM